MAAHTTPLLSDFDFNVTSSANTLQNSPPLFDPYHRPPTPDPRFSQNSHTQRKPRDLYYRPSSPAIAERRLRRRPTAIHIGAANNKPHAPPLTSDSDAGLPFCHSATTEFACTSLAPLLPSTPSPQLAATSPSLSSSGTTVESSPTLTPTSALPSTRGAQHDLLGHFGVSDEWQSQRKYGLRRAKRLPHRDYQDLWEVHAIVHLSEAGDERQREQQTQQEAKTRVVESIPDPIAHVPSEATTYDDRYQGASEVEEQVASTIPFRRRTRAVRFHGVQSESASRENSLKKVQKEESSTYSLSKYQFPAPPGHYLVGTFGHLHSPTQIHYRGASFDLVNPHASLLLGPSNFETPAEIDGLLDDYFETSCPTPTTMLYGDAETARRNIMHLDGAGDEPPPTPPNRQQPLPSPPSPSQSELSDPFGPGLSDDESQAAEDQQDAHNSGQDSTYAGILANYDYTREGELPASHQSTLQALEGGPSAKDSPSEAYMATLAAAKEVHPNMPLHVALNTYRSEMAPAPRDSVTQSRAATAMRGDFKPYERTSDVPTSDRTYGDTNQLLNLPPRSLNTIIASGIGAGEEAPPQIRPAPVRSLTEQSTMSVGPGLRSAQGSLHDPDSDESLDVQPPTPPDPAGLGFDFGFFEQHRGLSVAGHGPPTRRESLFEDAEEWETEPSHSVNEFEDVRLSEESYANTSHYSGNHRLSAMTDPASTARAVRSDSGGTIRPCNAQNSVVARESAMLRQAFDSDVNRATDYLHKMYKDKTLNQDIEEHLVSGITGRTTHRQRKVDRTYLGQLREDTIRSDLELDNLRKKNPVAFGVAVDRVAASLRQQKEISRSRLDRFVDFFRTGTKEQRQSSAIMGEALVENDERGLLSSAAASDDHHSTFEWSESNNTFRTIRDSASIIGGRAGLDFGDRPCSPIAYPPVAMTTGEQRSRSDPQPGASVMQTPPYKGKGKGRVVERPESQPPQQGIKLATLRRDRVRPPVRRAAMSSQTTLRHFQISGSPTSNIQGAYTDSEMLQASTNWNMRSHQRLGRANTHHVGPYSPLIGAQESVPGDQGRLLVRPGESMDARTMELQLKWSEDFLFRCVWTPVTCFLFYNGSFDWWIAKKSDGRIKEMAPRKKREAFHQMFLGSIAWAIVIVVIVVFALMSQ